MNFTEMSKQQSDQLITERLLNTIIFVSILQNHKLAKQLYAAFDVSELI
jgi:hypothetical protein